MGAFAVAVAPGSTDPEPDLGRRDQGRVLGLLLGWLCCKVILVYGFPLDPKVYFISRLPVNVRPNEFIITGVFAILICLVATIFPAMYAARLRPADGLRAE